MSSSQTLAPKISPPRQAKTNTSVLLQPRGSEADVIPVVSVAVAVCNHNCCTIFLRGARWQVTADAAVAALEANRDMVVGFKIRLSADVAGDGRNEAGDSSLVSSASAHRLSSRDLRGFLTALR
jgi:hypothetical protein